MSLNLKVLFHCSSRTLYLSLVSFCIVLMWKKIIVDIVFISSQKNPTPKQTSMGKNQIPFNNPRMLILKPKYFQ